MTNKQITRTCKIPYCCIRCGYTTSQKPDIKKHLYDLKKPCPAIVNKIELTDEIKQDIIDNRVHHLKIETKINNAKYIKKNKSNIIQNIHNDEYRHYIYLLRAKENVRHNENIYKIGKTKTKELTVNLERLLSYGKGTELIMISRCNNSTKLEQNILEIFNTNFTRHIYGNEYFIGNYKEMAIVINNLIKNELEDEVIELEDENIELEDENIETNKKIRVRSKSF